MCTLLLFVCVWPVFKANGCVYEGGFRRGERHGTGTCTFPGGERYAGAWHKGKMHGEGTLEIKGRTLTGIWNQGCVVSYLLTFAASTGPKQDDVVGDCSMRWVDCGCQRLELKPRPMQLHRLSCQISTVSFTY